MSPEDWSEVPFEDLLWERNQLRSLINDLPLDALIEREGFIYKLKEVENEIKRRNHKKTSP